MFLINKTSSTKDPFTYKLEESEVRDNFKTEYFFPILCYGQDSKELYIAHAFHTVKNNGC